MDKFGLHGQANFTVEDNILIVKGYGPWNIESMISARERVIPLAEELPHGPWGVLVMLKGEAIYVPDAAAYLVESIKKLRKIGRSATAIMAEETNEPEFAKRHLSAIYTEAGETFCFFKQKRDAYQWLAQKISEAEKIY